MTQSRRRATTPRGLRDARRHRSSPRRTVSQASACEGWRVHHTPCANTALLMYTSKFTRTPVDQTVYRSQQRIQTEWCAAGGARSAWLTRYSIFYPCSADAISAVPRSAGTAQALHPVSRTWLRGGSPHRILKKLPVRAATLLRGCAGRRQSQPHLAPRHGGLERAIHVSVRSSPPLAQMRLRPAMRGRPCSCAHSQLGPSRRAPRLGVLWPAAGCQLSQSALGCVMSHTSAQVASCRTRRRVCAYPCQPLARSRAGGLSIGHHGAHLVLVS